MSDKVYQRRLPKKRMPAGALFLDEVGRMLIVEPTYKQNWEIPGGVLSEEEIQSIRLPVDELRRFSFLEPEMAYGRLNSRLSRRVQQCLEALSNGQTLYMEDQ